MESGSGVGITEASVAATVEELGAAGGERGPHGRKRSAAVFGCRLRARATGDGSRAAVGSRGGADSSEGERERECGARWVAAERDERHCLAARVRERVMAAIWTEREARR